MEPDAMIFVFWMLSIKPTFSLSSFTFIKRLFSSAPPSAIRVVSSAYLRLLIFVPAILIQLVLLPAQHFAWCTLHRSWVSRVTIYIYYIDVYIYVKYFFPNLEPVCSMCCCFLNLHTDFSGGRSGGLVFPSLEEFSSVCCDLHNQRLGSAESYPLDRQESPYCSEFCSDKTSFSL